MDAEFEVGEVVKAGDGSVRKPRLGNQGDVAVSQLHGRYYEQALRGNLYVAQAIVTAPVIYTTAAGTGGPLIWNPPTSRYNVVPVAVGVAVTTVSTVAAALGLTGNGGQTSAPTSTTAIDGFTNALIGNASSAQSTAYRVGTPTNAGNFLMPFAWLHTGALTVDNTGTVWVDIGGCLICPPGSWVSVAASATATTTVAQLTMVYEEVPI